MTEASKGYCSFVRDHRGKRHMPPTAFFHYRTDARSIKGERCIYPLVAYHTQLDLSLYFRGRSKRKYLALKNKKIRGTDTGVVVLFPR
jgi:hypothetical protein